MIRGLAEAAVFTGLAVALHLGGLAMTGIGQGGPEAGGAGGQAVVSLQGASPATKVLVARWTDPPEAVSRMGVAPGAPAADVPRPTVTPRPDAARPDPVSPAALAPPQRPPAALPEVAPPIEPVKLEQAERRPPKARPEPAPDQTRRQRPNPPTLRAAGTGGGAAAGLSGASEQAATQAGRGRLLALWGGRIRAEVERRKHYPRAAAGTGGTAVLRIAVADDGRLQTASLEKSTGHPGLDRAALAAVRGTRFPPAPEGLEAGPHDFTFQMTFAQ